MKRWLKRTLIAKVMAIVAGLLIGIGNLLLRGFWESRVVPDVSPPTEPLDSGAEKEPIDPATLYINQAEEPFIEGIQIRYVPTKLSRRIEIANSVTVSDEDLWRWSREVRDLERKVAELKATAFLDEGRRELANPYGV